MAQKSNVIVQTAGILNRGRRADGSIVPVIQFGRFIQYPLARGLGDAGNIVQNLGYGVSGKIELPGDHGLRRFGPHEISSSIIGIIQVDLQELLSVYRKNIAFVN